MADETAPAAPSEAERRRLAKARRRAAELDRHPGLLAAARRLRQRLPGDDRFGDPLSTAGDEPVALVGRQVSALQPERPSVSREVGLGLLQLWQSVSEAQGRGRGERELALLFTDLVGFSSWALGAGDEAAVALLRETGLAVEGAIADGGGTIVKRLGDGVMAVFEGPAAAVGAAQDAQARLAAVEVDGYRPQLRAGVHLGRPRRLGGDYLGVDVNIAARVSAAARGGEVLASAPACAQLSPEAFSVGRARRLKAPGAPPDLRVSSVRKRL